MGASLYRLPQIERKKKYWRREPRLWGYAYAVLLNDCSELDMEKS